MMHAKWISEDPLIFLASLLDFDPCTAIELSEASFFVPSVLVIMDSGV
jgi:hypothetical protein